MGMSKTDYYMMSLRENITRIEEFTSVGTLSAQSCCYAGLQIINCIQSYGDQVMEDAQCVVKELQPRKKRKSDWIIDQLW